MMPGVCSASSGVRNGLDAGVRDMLPPERTLAIGYIRVKEKAGLSPAFIVFCVFRALRRFGRGQCAFSCLLLPARALRRLLGYRSVVACPQGTH